VNWMTLAEQLPGFCWMVALVASITIVLLGLFGRPIEVSKEEEPLNNIELLVSQALWIYSNHTVESSRKAARGFVRHLRMMGYEVGRPSEIVGEGAEDDRGRRGLKMPF
jgi:hypothetical protein